jgi:DNA-binding MarR family transcriptional regulator
MEGDKLKWISKSPRKFFNMPETVLEELELPESCKKVFSVIIEEGGALSSKEIVLRVSCSTRAVRYALRRLLESEYLERRPCLHDMRQTLYSIKVQGLKGELTLTKRVE